MAKWEMEDTCYEDLTSITQDCGYLSGNGRESQLGRAHGASKGLENAYFVAWVVVTCVHIVSMNLNLV